MTIPHLSNATYLVGDKTCPLKANWFDELEKIHYTFSFYTLHLSMDGEEATTPSNSITVYKRNQDEYCLF